MKFLTLCKFAFSNILGRNIKAFIGLSGIVILVSLFTFLASLGYGINNMVTNQVSAGQIKNLIGVSPGNETAIKLDKNAVDKISSTTGVDKICEIIDVPGKFSYKGTTADTSVSAVCPEYFNFNGIQLPDKVKLEEAGANEPSPVIINSYLAKMFGFSNPKDMLGEEITLDFLLNRNISNDLDTQNINEKRTDGGKFRVVAVLSRGQSPFIYVPYSVVAKSGIVYNTSIQVTVKTDSEIQTIRSIIEAQGFQTMDARDTVTEIRNFFGFFRLFLFALGLIVIIISTISLINMLSTSFAGRKKELAWLKAMGMKNYEVKSMLAIESVLLASLGTVCGLIIGVAFSHIADFTIRFFAIKYSYSYDSIFKTPPVFIITLLLSAISIGIIIGMIYARRVNLIKAQHGIKYNF